MVYKDFHIDHHWWWLCYDYIVSDVSWLDIDKPPISLFQSYITDHKQAQTVFIATSQGKQHLTLLFLIFINDTKYHVFLNNVNYYYFSMI